MSRIAGDSIGNSKQREQINIGAGWWFLTVPLLFLAGAISIPVVLIGREVQRVREKRFAAEMKKLGRTIALGDVVSGSVLIEWLSLKGPTRWWWTPDNLESSVTLFPVDGSLQFDESHELYLEKYSGSNGSAQLIMADQEQRWRFREDRLLTGNLVCVEIPPPIGRKEA